MEINHENETKMQNMATKNKKWINDVRWETIKKWNIRTKRNKNAIKWFEETFPILVKIILLEYVS